MDRVEYEHLKPYAETDKQRARLDSAFKYGVRETARLQGVAHSAICKSIKQIRNKADSRANAYVPRTESIDDLLYQAAERERTKADIKGTIPPSAAHLSPSSETPKKHFLIPDTQVKPGVPLYHIEWIGQYIADNPPDRLIPH